MIGSKILSLEFKNLKKNEKIEMIGSKIFIFVI